MADNKLIIDEEYCKDMSSYFARQGKQIDSALKSYITILKRIRKNSIKEGEAAEALEEFIALAEKMREGITENVSEPAKKTIEKYMLQIDRADRYGY